MAAASVMLTGVEVEVRRNVTDVDDVLTAAAERSSQPLAGPSSHIVRLSFRLSFRLSSGRFVVSHVLR
ncbi:MAG: hypothetical protein WAK86_15590 [Pseudonocardiaceae bacterium]